MVTGHATVTILAQALAQCEEEIHILLHGSGAARVLTGGSTVLQRSPIRVTQAASIHRQMRICETYLQEDLAGEECTQGKV